MRKSVFPVIGLFLAIQLQAAVKLNSLFTDNAVFQRNVEVPVWGWADEGEKVTIDFAGQKVSTTAQNGKWMLKLKPMKENSSPQEIKITVKNTIILKNILVGEVWICSGQSNMEWALSPSSAHPQTGTSTFR